MRVLKLNLLISEPVAVHFVLQLQSIYRCGHVSLITSVDFNKMIDRSESFHSNSIHTHHF